MWPAAKLIQTYDVYKIVDYRLVKLLFAVIEHLSNCTNQTVIASIVVDKIEDDEVDSHSWPILIYIFLLRYS